MGEKKTSTPLTIKHIERSGYESIQCCASVTYHPKNTNADRKGAAELIAFGCSMRGGPTDEHGVCRYGTGRVFVMNENGATVAMYDFD
jgi:hypothetical protein